VHRCILVEARPRDEHIVAGADDLRHIDGLCRGAVNDDARLGQRGVRGDGAPTAVGRIVIHEFGAPWVKVSVAKPGAIPAARDVGIVIERTAADYA